VADSADENVYEVEELLVQPGTYFNPQTEVVVVVDDSASLDQEVFDLEAYEGADWVRISEDVPVDEDARDQLLDHFQTHYHPGATGSMLEDALSQGDDGPDPEPEPGHVGDADEA
jgi:hypothetical protein